VLKLAVEIQQPGNFFKFKLHTILLFVTLISSITKFRLLGIFQRVEHVLLVGCGGGVPHYSDARRHPRRGDIVISYPESSPNSSNDDSEDFVYAHFEYQKNNQITSKTWMPNSMDMSDKYIY
jgi:hypothetical protein